MLVYEPVIRGLVGGSGLKILWEFGAAGFKEAGTRSQLVGTPCKEDQTSKKCTLNLTGGRYFRQYT